MQNDIKIVIYLLYFKNKFKNYDWNILYILLIFINFYFFANKFWKAFDSITQNIWKTLNNKIITMYELITNYVFHPQYLGTWYEAEHYVNIFEYGTRCVKSNYTKAIDGRYLVSNEIMNRLYVKQLPKSAVDMLILK